MALRGVGKVFGPITLLWFVTLAALGLWHVVRQPGVLAAVNPIYAVRFFTDNGMQAVLVLGSVFLVVTGGEALYADMGHFGKRPIRLAWFAIVLPALLLNYFGQGALLISNPAAVVNPFFLMAPTWALYPVVAIATIATVIASQALISGSYSLTMQAVQLGYSPRLDIQHTSASEKGQIYIPAINWVLMLACIGLVLGFRSSSNLAAAYGVAVTTTMVVTSVLFYVVARERWRWSLPVAIASRRTFSSDRPRVLGCESAQDSTWGLVPTRRRRGSLHLADYLEEGATDPGEAHEGAHAAHRRVRAEHSRSSS